MITKYNEFNIDESVYTEKDINNILDKGFLNFDESDFAVLNSYATDDKELKFLLDKIKSYKEPFEKLNASLKDEKGIKKQECFRKWLELHEELTKLENELRFKYKIEDLRKLGNLRESFSFRPDYKYNSIPVAINNKEEFDEYKNIIYKFCSDNNLVTFNLDNFFNGYRWFEEGYKSNPIYLRLTSPNTNYLNIVYGELGLFQHSSRQRDLTYEKLFTIGEFRKVLNNIKEYGKGIVTPSYAPKKFDRTLEGVKHWPYRFKTREEMVKDYGENWEDRIADANPDESVGVNWSELMNYLLGQPCEMENIDTRGNYQYYYPTNIIDRGHWLITNEMITKNEPKVPTYAPKKFDRTLESVSENLYKFVIFKTYNKDEFTEVQKKIRKHGYGWSDDDMILIESDRNFPCYIFVQDVNGDEWDKKIFYDGENCLDNGSPFITLMRRSAVKRKEDICPTIFTSKDADYISLLFKTGRVEPSYKPKKFDRTLEAFNFDYYEYDSIIFKINNMDDVKKIVDLFYDAYKIENIYLNKEEGKEMIIKEFRGHFGTERGCETNYLMVSKKSNYFFAIYKSHLSEYMNDEYNPDSHIYTIDELSKFFNVPNYAPRRFDRTLESISSNKWLEVVFEVKNLEESNYVQEVLLNKGYKWWNKEGKTVIYHSEYPYYIFVKFEGKKLSGLAKKDLDYGSTIERYINEWNKYNGKYALNPKVFKPKDIKDIDSIEKFGQVGPSYAPKKFNREI